MKSPTDRVCIAFSGTKRIAEGDLLDVALTVKKRMQKPGAESVLIFDAMTSAPIEIDLRGSAENVLKRLEGIPEGKSGPGRPKLGVVSREISLLPEHWEWLGRQRGGASATLRKLVEESKKTNRAQDQKRQAQDALHKFMTAMAGDLPEYEEALRALYAGKPEVFATLIAPWPKDIAEHVRKLSRRLF